MGLTGTLRGDTDDRGSGKSLGSLAASPGHGAAGDPRRRRTVSRMSCIAALLVYLMAATVPASAGTPSPAAAAEIAHLLAYLGNSGCAFYRNGSWHDAREARTHLETKKNYLLKRSLIGSTEEFIDRAATSSSVSGERYLVRCAPSAPVAASAWLRAELARIRALQPKPEA
jgi:hypothetical protein